MTERPNAPQTPDVSEPGTAPAPPERPGEEDGLPLTGEPVASMRLRADPPRVTRLSRKMLGGVAMVASLGIGAALVYALQTRTGGQTPEEVYATDNRAKPDALNSLPRDYTGPVLGAPLPGDLGRPILEAQNRGVPAEPPMIGAPGTHPAPPPPAGPDPAQLAQQEREAARTARLFTSGDTARAASAADATPGLPMPAQSAAATAAPPPSAQDRQVAFLAQSPDRRTLAADRVAAPASPNILQAGAVIPAALITGIRSDLPGQITAQVTQNIYDSPTGRILLVPQGSRVIGEHSNDVGFGQRRVLLVWNRMIFPNGRSILLERQPGADPQGYAGLEDRVNYHWLDLAKAAGLSTLLGIGAELGSDDNDRLVRAIRDGGQTTINDAGQQIVRRQLNVTPTLTIRPGFPVRVVVTRDIILEPYRG